MNSIRACLFLCCAGGMAAHAADSNRVATVPPGDSAPLLAVDPAKDLPRYPAVEPSGAVATWKVKPGFKLELAAHEPQVRDPIAISFDENGRMFVCEMIDYSEMREVMPHLGRVSLLEDRDGDGYYETSTVFADDLPWPTGLIWANGALFVGATPDIWRFEDRDGDGRAEVREKVYTGLGTGVPRLNVQQLLNSFHWSQDNRIHVQTAGSSGRGHVTSPKRPDLAGIELNGRDFWFDPRTYEFGVEAGGAQYGMSFDDYGRKFGASNSDHLQYWVYDDRYARNPFFTMPRSRQSIAADGGAAEVYRISPDEPWRIVRTRWRVGGVVRGPIEGGGRVSGYFTGATGTSVYRGDAYGEGFVNNTFTGDAGGQLVHRKILQPDGVSLVGRRPDDEQGFEFAASTDTWVRIVNFANAPDGCLYICDMYREVIEHPDSIPEEIKRHIDLNSGNDRGRLYRLVPSDPAWRRRSGVRLGQADTAELVRTLEHPNGWHRDAASRLLYERQDRAAIPMLRRLLVQSPSPLAKLHALGALGGLGGLDEDAIMRALTDGDRHVRERGILLAEKLVAREALTPRIAEQLAALAADTNPRVRFQLAFTVQAALAGLRASVPATEAITRPLTSAYVRLAAQDGADPWLSAALLSGPPDLVTGLLFPALTQDVARAQVPVSFVAKLIEIRAASKPAAGYASLIDFLIQGETNAEWLRSFAAGLQRASVPIEQADPAGRLSDVFNRAAATATNANASESVRLEAIELLGVAPVSVSRPGLTDCLARTEPDEVQAAAINTLAQSPAPQVTAILVRHWPAYGPKAKQTALTVLTAREDRAIALLEAIQAGEIKADELPTSQVQSLVQHRVQRVASLARRALAPVLPPTRAEVTVHYGPAAALSGNAARGQVQYVARCMVCHRAAGQGIELGPDLISVKSSGRESLLTAILDPNKEVAPQYIAYEVSTRDGNNYTGMIAQDDASGLVFRIMGGAEIRIPRSNVRGSRSAGQSLMPEGLEAGMTVQDMADLLTFIEELNQ